MRASSSILALVPFIAAALAQVLGSEPPCASACLTNAITSAGCALDDQACQCGTAIGAIGGYAAPCLIASCPVTALVAVQSIGSQLCVDYSVSAGLTTIASNGTTTMTSTTSQTSTSGVVVATTTMVSSSHTGSSSSSSMQITSSATSTSSVRAATTSASSSSSSAGAQAMFGAAAVPVGGILGAVLGAVALL